MTACAGAAGAREHDAMAAALRDLEREHAAAASGELALGGATLDRDALVAAVLARNPELEVARETWRAQAAAYPSAVALGDPMLTYEVAPFSVTGDVPFGQRVQVSQKLPFPGKLSLAGDAALAEADAARADFGLLRQQLAEAAVGAFDDYYVAARALEVNTHHRELLERIQRSAAAQYSVGRAASQDPLEAEGELIMLDRERLMLAVQQHAASARINRLLRRSPDAPLPPPPSTLVVPAPADAAGPVDPKVAARARIRARAADVAVAERAFYPDFEVMAGYDSMFDDWRHQYTLGVAIEIPLSRAGRHGAVDKARAGLAGATAELEAVTSTLAEDRSHAQREVDEARTALALFEQRAVPNAKARVDAALAGFTSGQVPFPTVMMAERALREAELSVERARADLDRKTATLDRLNGRIAGGAR
ncbi:MAG TPA: TolC family protein [Kofleriaceae bacterium]|nr:TolC family protein [Kofleriaceae bacterium]